MPPAKSLTRRVAEIALMAGLYFGAAQLGYSLAFLDTIVSPVWPAAGVALALFLLLGYHLFWGVFIAALVGTGASVSTAAATNLPDMTFPPRRSGGPSPVFASSGLAGVPPGDSTANWRVG